MRMTLFLIAGCVLFLAGDAAHAQKRDSGTPATRELPAPPKVKSKRTAQTATPAPAGTVQRDSTLKPAVPRKSKAAPAATARQEKKLPRVEKPAKPSA
jgi:hypothetical protein